MPFESDRQRRYMFARHPGIARRWVDEAHEAGVSPTRRRRRRRKVHKSMDLVDISKGFLRNPPDNPPRFAVGPNTPFEDRVNRVSASEAASRSDANRAARAEAKRREALQSGWMHEKQATEGARGAVKSRYLRLARNAAIGTAATGALAAGGYGAVKGAKKVSAVREGRAQAAKRARYIRNAKIGAAGGAAGLLGIAALNRARD